MRFLVILFYFICYNVLLSAVIIKHLYLWIEYWLYQVTLTIFFNAIAL